MIFVFSSTDESVHGVVPGVFSRHFFSRTIWYGAVQHCEVANGQRTVLVRSYPAVIACLDGAGTAFWTYGTRFATAESERWPPDTSINFYRSITGAALHGRNFILPCYHILFSIIIL